MTTVDEVITIQKTDSVLYTPTIDGPQNFRTAVASSTSSTLKVNLYNATKSNNVFAYITGLAIDNSNSVFLLQSDGVTPYYPSNPSSNGSPLAVNCAISLGAIGSTRTVTIPHIAGGRIWFCVDGTLTFRLNPGQQGPGLVEPSVSNTSDPNYSLEWDFCEFTYNDFQLYANITYVDFVAIPIALTLTTASGSVSHVGGLPVNGLDTVCSNLIAQNNRDGAGWNQLVITKNGANLRALSPSNGIVLNRSLFSNYWTDYINQVFQKYASEPLVVDTQASWGTVKGYTSNDRSQIVFNGVGAFNKPSAEDIFGANSGAFAAQPNNTAQLLNIGARIDAAINRSTLLTNPNQPDSEQVSTFYTNSVTNHYSRIVHAANVDGRGYTFPYDDVTSNGGPEQSGFVADSSPSNFLITIGGGNAYASSKRALNPMPKMMKRSVAWTEDIKEPTIVDLDRDIEKGEHPKLLNEMQISEPTPKTILPPAIERIVGKYLTQFRASPLAARLRPIFDAINQFLVSFLSLSMRAILSRFFILAFVLIFYFLGMVPRGSEVETQRRILESAGLMDSTLVA